MGRGREEVMKGERCILCRGDHPTAVGAQRGLSPGPGLPMGARLEATQTPLSADLSHPTSQTIQLCTAL